MQVAAVVVLLDQNAVPVCAVSSDGETWARERGETYLEIADSVILL